MAIITKFGNDNSTGIDQEKAKISSDAKRKQNIVKLKLYKDKK